MTAASFISAILLGAQAGSDTDSARYLRLTPQGAATECTFRVRRGEKERTVESVTERGGSTLTVTSRYDSAGMLLDARAVSRTGERQKTVGVEVDGSKAKVWREGLDAQEFEVPKETIVTSAPDWTDTFLVARRYDRTRGGRQEFPGLWIHPVQPAQRLTFSAEHVGSVSLEHGAEKLDLVRLSIRLRGNSEYAAWVDAAGRMIKLVSLPFKETGTHLVLEGFEKPAAGLTP